MTKPATSATEATTEATEASSTEGAGREAAKYRRKLRDAEAERDQLRTTLDTVQRAEVVRHIGNRIASPELLWIDGNKAGDFFNDKGGVDEAKVTKRLQEIRVKFGDGVMKSRGPYAPNEGRNPTNPARGNKFASAFVPPS